MIQTPDANRTIVGVDGSSSSIDALRYAATLSTALGWPIEAVTTWVDPMAGSYHARGDWPVESDADALLHESITRAFGDSPPSGLTAKLIAGPAARTLIDESAHAQMLVLGSRGHGAFVGLLLGSVSATCAEHAHCPVLVVHPAATGTPVAGVGSDPN